MYGRIRVRLKLEIGQYRKKMTRPNGKKDHEKNKNYILERKGIILWEESGKCGWEDGGAGLGGNEGKNAKLPEKKKSPGLA